MAALSEVELLAAWEAARGVAAAACGAALLASLRPETTLDETLRMPLGRRDGELLALREASFGTTLAALAVCPSCGVRVEIEIPTPALTHKVTNETSVDVNGVDVRLPNTLDLLAAASAGGEAEARDVLLRRCVGAPGALTPEAIDACVRALAGRDPAGDTSIALVCPDCGFEWESAIDVAAHFWSEIDAAAMHTLRDVHVLAAAYGWTEQEILAIPPRRRRIYIDMVQG